MPKPPEGGGMPNPPTGALPKAPGGHAAAQASRLIGSQIVFCTRSNMKGQGMRNEEGERVGQAEGGMPNPPTCVLPKAPAGGAPKPPTELSGELVNLKGEGR